LIAAIAAGDMRALGELYLRYGTMILRFLCRTIGDFAAAEDLCQEVFLSLPKSVARYRELGKSRSWLFGIAANKARAYQRRKWTRERLLRAYAFLVPLQRQASSASGTSPGDSVAEALERLPLEQRQVLMLQVGEGMSGVEIAEALSIGHAAVRVRLHRARAALRQAVRGLDREGDEP